MAKYLTDDQQTALRAIVSGYLQEKHASALSDWLEGVEFTIDRAGFVLSGDLDQTMALVQSAPGRLARPPFRTLVRETIMFAVSEEYLPGAHVYDDSGLLRALSIGKVVKDTKKMEISVAPAARAKLVKLGDMVVGQVETAATSNSSVAIYYVNGKRMVKGFAGMLMLRSARRERGPRAGPPVKLGDVVRCKVYSMFNGIIQLSIDEDATGVLFALCGNCGRPLLRGGSRAKCDECGNVEDRKLASDFGKTPISP